MLDKQVVILKMLKKEVSVLKSRIIESLVMTLRFPQVISIKINVN